MKKILILLTMTFFFLACEKEEYSDTAPATHNWVGLKVANASASAVEVFEGNGAATSSTTFTVTRGGELDLTDAITVDIELSGDATLDTDFTVIDGTSVTASGFSVTIPADEQSTTFMLQTITNVDLQSNRSVNVEIVGNSANYSIGYPNKDVIVFTIADDDCAYDLEDDFTGPSTVDENSSLFGEFSGYDAEVTFVDETTLSIGNFFDSGWEVFATIDPLDNSIVLSHPAPFSGIGTCGGVPITDWEVTGTGSLSPCTASISLEAVAVSPVICGGFAIDITMDIQFPL